MEKEGKFMEKKSEFILTGKQKDFIINPKGLGCELHESLLKHKDRIAQIDSETGLRDTFGDLMGRAVRTALEMRRRGVTSEDMVTLCAHNHVNSAAAILASLFLKVKVSVLDPSLSASDTKHLLNLVKPKMIFITPDAEVLMEEALEGAPFEPEIVSLGPTERYERFVNFLRPSPEEEEEFVPVPAEDLKETIVVLFSSGTTGLAKGICLHHYGILGQAQQKKHIGNITFLMVASLYWMSAINMFTASILAGFARVILPKFNPKTAWEAVHAFKVNVMFLAPCLLLDLVKNGIPKGVDVSSVFAILSGGGALKKDQLQFIRAQLPTTMVIPGYGMTEVSGGVALYDFSDPEDKRLALEKPEAAGRPLSGMFYKVVDPETNEILGPNRRGELRIKSEFLLNGYYEQDSSDIWDEDGWFKTGDIIYYDEDRCFFHVDRIKEMLKYKSWHVAPAKLEEAIGKHPDVLNVIVVGIPHPEDGDHPCGVVVLKENSKVTPEELRKFADDQLDERQKLRGGIKVVEEFPLTPSGKIRRIQLRNLVISGNC